MRTVQRVYIPKGVVSLHYRSSYYFAPNNNTSRYTAHPLFPPLSSSGPPLELELITRTGVPISSSKMRSLEMNPPAQITAKIFQSSCRRFGAMLEPPNLACWLEMKSPSDSTHGLWCISPNGGLTAHSRGTAMLVKCVFVFVCVCVCVRQRERMCVCVCVYIYIYIYIYIYLFIYMCVRVCVCVSGELIFLASFLLSQFFSVHCYDVLHFSIRYQLSHTTRNPIVQL